MLVVLKREGSGSGNERIQRILQTHVKRFHTFACDAVGLQCWVNFRDFAVDIRLSHPTISIPLDSTRQTDGRAGDKEQGDEFFTKRLCVVSGW